LLLTIFGGLVGGVAAAILFAAGFRDTVGDAGALVLGFVLAWLVPLFFSIRANLALKRQRRPVMLRRLVSIVLIGAIQLAASAAGLARVAAQDQAMGPALSAAALPLLGPVPVLGGVLKQSAATTPTDATTTDPTTTTTTTATTTTDPTTTTTTTTTAAAATGLSPRSGGRVTGTVSALATTTDGGLVALRYAIAFGGAATLTVTDLGAFAELGSPTRVEDATDGTLAVVLSGQHVLVAPPGKAAQKEASISKGARVGGLEVVTVRDIAVAPGGALLLTIDAFDDKSGKPVQALVAKAAGGAAFVVKRGGEALTAADAKEGAKEGDIADTTFGYAIKRQDGRGNVVVEEIVLEGDADVGTKLDGAQYVMNPRRLYSGTVDAPRALAIVAQSGDEPSGIEGVTLQGFADAVALPDGRVVFDANFNEDGPRGWLFQARVGSSPFAVGKELVGKPEAPFSDRAPRLMRLSVEPDGAFAFVNREGALVRSQLSRPGESKVGLLRATATGASGDVGGVARVNAPRVMVGGEFVAAAVEVLAKDGARVEALVLASVADLNAERCEVLAIEGGVVPSAETAAPKPAKDDKATTTTPTTATTPARRIKSLFVLEGHEEALWGQAG
jgi:hypothetical protein